MVRMFPSDANPAGNVFGGEILKQIDTIAGIIAQRYCRKNAVTASIDKVDFLKPVYVGDALILNGRINYTGKSSMEIEVTVESEQLRTGKITKTGTAFLTMVALDSDGRPTDIPQLLLTTKEEKKRFNDAKKRVEIRRQNKEKEK